MRSCHATDARRSHPHPLGFDHIKCPDPSLVGQSAFCCGMQANLSTLRPDQPPSTEYASQGAALLVTACPTFRAARKERRTSIYGDEVGLGHIGHVQIVKSS